MMKIMQVDEPMEENLIQSVRNGDHQAFEKIYRSYVNRIYALCLRLAGEKRKAEELTQDVFVRAWQKLHTFKGNSSFYTWLYRLALNQIISALRRENTYHSTEMPSAEWENAVNPQARFSLDVRMDLETAIQALPRGARMVLVLHDVEGYRHGEIADMLGISDGTSKAQLHRARKLIREVLKDELSANKKYIR